MTDRAAFDEWADKRGLYLSDRWMYWEGWQEAVRQERERTKEMEAALSDLRYAISASPSCQQGMLERCRCLKCGMLRSYDLLVDIRARSAASTPSSATPAQS